MKDNKNDNKSRDIFYGIVAIATLIVALIGATLAYFSITVNSAEGAVSARSAVVTINYIDGQNMVAQAEELIPATFAVVQNVYEHQLEAINAQAANEDTETDRYNLCLDANDREVCSVHRFSVSSADGARTISAMFGTENNEFDYLAYAVRDVTNGTWLTLDDTSNVKYLPLNKCYGSDETNGCYSFQDEEKVYGNLAKNNIFGIDTNGDIKTKEIGGTEQVYDIVLFINENNAPQNGDQGKSYAGTVIIDVLGGNEQITGKAY